jgi:hypothetical protein
MPAGGLLLCALAALNEHCSAATAPDLPAPGGTGVTGRIAALAWIHYC